MRSHATADPFGTAQLRAAVIAAWAASPARFREDANAEEELVRGAYRDRVIVELAQNAADASTRVGEPGRLLLRLGGMTFTAANTGAPLDAAGVEGLSTLRASTKRDEEAVGRFGVGFAAILAVTDEPAVLSRSGGVRWSRADVVAAAGTVPELAGELARRGTAVPVLRLPQPAAGEVPDGYDTVVRLPLRDEAARRLVTELLDGVDDALLLALPGLAEIVLDTETASRRLVANRSGADVQVTDGDRTTRWRLAERSGQVPAELRAERPAEEPDRWRASVAVPVGSDGQVRRLPAAVPRVVHAPTPTDERTELPALVLASFPLDSSRRRVVPGRLTELLAGHVAAAYAELATELAGGGPSVLDLVPGPLPVSELDGTLHRSIVPALAEAAFVPAAEAAPPGEAGKLPAAVGAWSRRLAPRDVVLVDGLRSAARPAALARFVAGLPDPEWWRVDPLRRLGAQVVPLGDVVDGLGQLSLESAQWRDLYAALDGADLESLGTLPVPLADGRLVRGVRGVLLPTGDIDAATLAALGLRVVAAPAVHPLLARLGATEATAATVLRDPAVRAAVGGGEEAVTEPVLRLVAASGLTTEDEPWLAQVLLPDGAGALAPAGELWLPDSPVLELLDVEFADYVVDRTTVETWGRHVLRAVGVRDGFAVDRVPDVTLDEESWHDLDDEPGWVDAVLDRLPGQELPPVLVELVAVRDLDVIRDDQWAGALAVLVADPSTRRAIIEPAYVLLDDGNRKAVPSYTAWWLREHAQFDGVQLGLLCAPDAEPLVGRVLPAIPVQLADDVCRALGLARTVADLVREPARTLDRLADPALSLAASDLAAVYAAMSAAGLDPEDVPPPERVRVPDGDATRLVAAADVVVADGPHWLQLDLPALLPGGADLAALLDLDLAGDRTDPSPSSSGTIAQAPAAVARLLPAAPATYAEHDDLVVSGSSVEWWMASDGGVHAATLDGLARGLAWAAGRWDLRFEVAEVLRDPDAVPGLLADRGFAP